MNGHGQRLDRELARSLTAPPLPAGFRARLTAAMARAGAYSLPESRVALAADRERALRELRQGYLRLQGRTLLLLLLGAFAAGLLARTVAPVIFAHYGEPGLVALATAGALAGTLVASAWWWPELRP
jgi:hypothetical protein